MDRLVTRWEFTAAPLPPAARMFWCKTCKSLSSGTTRGNVEVAKCECTRTIQLFKTGVLQGGKTISGLKICCNSAHVYR